MAAFLPVSPRAMAQWLRVTTAPAEEPSSVHHRWLTTAWTPHFQVIPHTLLAYTGSVVNVHTDIKTGIYIRFKKLLEIKEISDNRW